MQVEYFLWELFILQAVSSTYSMRVFQGPLSMSPNRVETINGRGHIHRIGLTCADWSRRGSSTGLSRPHYYLGVIEVVP